MPGKMFIRKGHALVYQPNHPYASKWGYIPRARLVKEAEIGQILPRSAVFHHVNGIPLDDIPENIMVFSKSSDHTNYHREQRALKACGNAKWRQCIYCDGYGDPVSNEWHQLVNGNAYHRKCKSDYDRRRYGRSKHGSYRVELEMQ